MKTLFIGKKIIFSNFLIFSFQLLLTLIQGKQDPIEFPQDTSFIPFKGQIIFVNNSTNKIQKLVKNNDVYNIESLNYSSIIKNKELLNLEDSNFIIFGLNSNNKLCFQIDNNTNVIDTDIEFTNVNQSHIHCSSVEKCVVALTTSDGFEIHQINLFSPLDKKTITHNQNGGTFIKCASFKDSNVFCILGINKNIIYYSYTDFQSSSLILNLICGSNCKNGSVSTINIESTNKFLVCYQYVDIINCQYFLINNNNITASDKYENVINFIRECTDSILITKVSNYSIFLKATCFIEKNFPYSILKFISFDFKIKLELNPNHMNKAINFFNDKENYYDFYFESQNSQKYYLKINEFLPLNQKEIIYFSLKGNETFDFSSNHEEQTLHLLLNQNTILNMNDKRIENNIQNYHNFTIKIKDNFTFFKTNQDNLTIFYCYNKSNSEDEDGSISLIGKIDIKNCYDSCLECNLDKIGSSDYHYCTQCNEDYYPFYEKTKTNDFFNCYLNSSGEVSNAYFSNGTFYYCNESCNSCDNENNCLTCIAGFYFKVDNNNSIIYDNYCLKEVPYKYFIDYNANIFNKRNQTIQTVYRPCYETCSSCKTNGSIEQNNCIDCIENLTRYNFNKGQCLINTSLCTDARKFWKLEKNNISCIDECNSSIISQNISKGQCVSDCKNFVNPFLKLGDKDINYLSLTCINKTYCIPYQTCNEIGFKISPDGEECLGSCEDYDVFEFDNIIDYFKSLPVPTTEIEIHNMTMDEKLFDINKRKKRIEVLKEEKNYDEVMNFFGKEAISNYNDLFKTQNTNPDDLGYLVTSTTYDNFTITIYPLDIEQYAYDNLFIVKNLGFVNFTKAYPAFLQYEIENGRIILVCIMEYFTHNYSINDLNYFIYAFNEISNSSFRLLQEEELPTIINLSNETFNHEIEYPLYNYYNESVDINKRNSEFLVDNMVNMYKDYPEVDLSNISDPFYNDVCFLFTSDVGTDMTLNDRRKEYYVNYSLCEDNCTLIGVINKDINPRSVCSCEIKSYIIFNEKHGKEYETGVHSSPPIKSFLCFKQTYNIYIGKNPIFWIFMIILVFQIYLLIMYIKYQTKVIQNIFGIRDNNSQRSIGNSISSSAYSKIIINENDLKSSNNKISNDNSLSEKGKSSGQDEKKSAPINAFNPPKKGLLKQNSTSNNNNMNTNDKDLISKSESTFIKENTNINNNININMDNKNFEGSEISYSDIKNDFELIEVNNLVEQNIIMENNFLSSPLTIEKIRKMKRIKKAMHPLKEGDNKIYHQTLEDILYSNNNKHKFKNKKNKEIANQLGGGDIINKNLIDYLSDNENKPRFPKNKIDSNITSEKYRTIGSDHIIFSGSVDNNKKDELIKDEISSENKLKKEKNKKSKNKDSLDDIFENKKNTLAKSLGKKDIHNLKYEEEKKIKTDDELDNDNKIKNQLKKIGKDKKFRPNSSLEKSKKYKKKSNEKFNKNNNIINIEKNKMNRINKESVKLDNKYNYKYKINPNKKLIDDSENSNGNLKNKSPEKDSSSSIKRNKLHALKMKNKKEIDINNKNNISNSSNKNKEIIYSNNKKEEENISGENKEGSKIVDSKRNMIKFQEETEIEGDKIKDLDIEKLKQKRTQNLDLINDRAPVSSVVEFLETENREILIEDNFILFYWKYFIKRELWFIIIRDKNKSLPYFIRYSSLGFCLTFLFLLNCFFFFESTVHKRYINALEGTNINISYYFKKEFPTTVYASLLGNIFKMLIIKLLLYRVFKIGKNAKRLMRNSAEKGLTKDEIEILREKREQYLKWYKKCLVAYFSVLMVITIFIGYICICYGGIYKNSINAFLFGILFSIILSFIFCGVLCFLIVVLYKIGKATNSKCVVSAYIVLSTLY